MGSSRRLLLLWLAAANPPDAEAAGFALGLTMPWLALVLLISSSKIVFHVDSWNDSGFELVPLEWSGAIIPDPSKFSAACCRCAVVITVTVW